MCVIKKVINYTNNRIRSVFECINLERFTTMDVGQVPGPWNLLIKCDT